MNKALLKELIDKITEGANESYELNSKVLIIDGLNTFLRNFTMVNFLNPQGNHIGGLVGFLKSIGFAIKSVHPTRVIIVFDGPGGADSKKNLYPEYKSNRHKNRITNYDIFNNKDEEDESIKAQINRLVQYLQTMPLDLICIDGVEADDIMGYLVKRFEKIDATRKITVMSADKDFLQLVSPKTQVYSPTKKKFYNTDALLEEFKVHPNNFLMYKTLLGDKSDCIPGVPGMGETKLLKYFPSLVKEEELDLNQILEICKQPESKHFLYSRVIERESQLKINYILMNLKETVLSPENIEIIESTLSNASKVYNKLGFLTMYYADDLGNSIQNTPEWIDTVFRSLQNFRQ